MDFRGIATLQMREKLVKFWRIRDGVKLYRVRVGVSHSRGHCSGYDVAS